MKNDVLVAVLLLIVHFNDVVASNNSTEKSSKSYVCPPNFVRLSYKCYYFSDTEENWQDAYWKCVDLHSNLATIKNKNQDKVLRRTLDRNTMNKFDRWIGGRFDWGTKTWIWAATAKNITYNGFPQDEDENLEQSWKCLILDPKRNYRWNSRSCTENKHYICQTKLKVVGATEKQRMRKKYQNKNSASKLNEIEVPAITSNALTDDVDFDNNLHAVAQAQRSADQIMFRPNKGDKQQRRRQKNQRKIYPRADTNGSEGVQNDGPVSASASASAEAKKVAEREQRVKEKLEKRQRRRLLLLQQRRERRMRERNGTDEERMRYRTFYAAKQSPQHLPVIVEEFSLVDDNLKE